MRATFRRRVRSVAPIGGCGIRRTLPESERLSNLLKRAGRRLLANPVAASARARPAIRDPGAGPLPTPRWLQLGGPALQGPSRASNGPPLPGVRCPPALGPDRRESTVPIGKDPGPGPGVARRLCNTGPSHPGPAGNSVAKPLRARSTRLDRLKSWTIPRRSRRGWGPAWRQLSLPSPRPQSQQALCRDRSEPTQSVLGSLAAALARLGAAELPSPRAAARRRRWGPLPGILRAR